MTRSTVILISVLCVIAFVGLAYYGWTHRWGGDMYTEVTPPLVLPMTRADKGLALEPAAFDDGVWETLKPLTVPLLHQVTTAPRSKHLVRQMNVRAFHNAKDAYFLFEWKDDAPSRVHETGVFPDGVAIGLPLDNKKPTSSIMMGFRSPLNIWQWKANLDAKFWDANTAAKRETANTLYTYAPKAAVPTAAQKVTSACQDIIAIRPGTVTVKEGAAVSGRGRWKDGAWRVIVKRALATGDAQRDAQLTAGKAYVTFAVWDGEKGDRGSRKSISEWVELDIEPASTAAAPAGGPGAPAGPAGGAGAKGATGPPAARAQRPRRIDVVAKKFEYTTPGEKPGEIRLQKGELVTIRLESLDVTHGMYIDGYGINIKARPGRIGTATFRADKAGRFTFRCSETCGEFHPYMIGYLMVEPNRRFHVFIGIAVAACLLCAAAAFVARKRKEASGNG
jgi:DMSO reductase family type II enzyme heme b subunit